MHGLAKFVIQSQKECRARQNFLTMLNIYFVMVVINERLTAWQCTFHYWLKEPLLSRESGKGVF